MPSLKINTEQIASAADTISTLNNDMRNGFQSVENAMNTLRNNWNSPAANNAFSKFNGLKKYYCEPRYQVMQNYVNFLLQQVGQGYEQTEDVNKALAEAFK